VEETAVAYPAFLMIGTLLWQNFLDAVTSPLRIVTENRAMLVKINFPREALLLSGFYLVGFNFAVRLLLIVPIFIYYDMPMTRTLLYFPLGVFALFSFGMLLGILMTPIGVLYNDVLKAVTLLSGFWIFITPVFYPTPTGDSLTEQITRWNPVTPLLDATRNWLIGQPAADVGTFVVISVCTCVLMLVGWVLYRVSLPHIIARMGM
jgi:lipopolysaccharide transport system permease protein